jgi:O-antigen ligase
MHTQPKARFVVPAATAILLTFGRNGMLPIEKVYTWLDQSINLFVVLIAPLFAIKDIYPRLLERSLLLFLPFLVLALWVFVCLWLGSPSAYRPQESALITILLTVLFASQISRFELRRLRHFVLLLAGLFSLYALTFAQSSLSLVFGGMLTNRLGVDQSFSNVIIFPRVMYMLVITCFVSLLIEKRIWVRIFAAMTAILPIFIALSTAGRGALVGLVLAAIVFAWGARRSKGFIALSMVVVLIVIVSVVINSFVPVMQQRIDESYNSGGRYPIWEHYLNLDLTWFGRGYVEDYPHNIFLEFLSNYGIVGLAIFLLVLGISITTIYRAYIRTRDEEVLWVASLLVLQMTAQQFSLDIFYGGLWAAVLLPLGLNWDYSMNESVGRVIIHRNVAFDINDRSNK